MKHKLLLLFTFITTFLQAQGFNEYDRLWSTYVGGNGLNFPKIVKDNNGNIIVAGSHFNPNISINHPVIREYFQNFIHPTNNPMMYQTDDYRVSYIAKFNTDGEIINSGYLPYEIEDIQLDDNNEIIIYGRTLRRDLGSVNVWFSEPQEDWNRLILLISKLDTDFNSIWTTYLPITVNWYNNITIDELGNIYGAGTTTVRNGITTEGTFYPEFTAHLNGNSEGNGLIFKLNSNGQLVWSTYYGDGRIIDLAYANDKLYMILQIYSTLNFPWITDNAYQTTPSILSLARFNPSNGQRELATYYGESDILTLADIEVTNDAIYISGDTSIFSDNTPFITSNSYQPTFGGGYTDYYLAKLDFNFNPIWGTYIGGSETEMFSLSQKNLFFNHNYLYFTASTGSTEISFDEHTFRPTNAGNSDLLMMKFNPNGQLVWGSFYGSNGNEFLPSLLPINDETFYLAGHTDSPKDITTPNTYQQYYSYLPDNRDYGQLFLAKFGFNPDLNTSDILATTLKIYPNPAKEKVYIKGFIHQDSWIEIYNLVGQKVITQKAKSGLSHEIKVQFLPKGTYIIKAIDINGKVFQENIVIH